MLRSDHSPSCHIEETRLRDIAADVGVDVAYVHRCFGSKERMFIEVLKTASADSGMHGVPADQIATMLDRHLFERAHVRLTNEVDPLLILVRVPAVPAASGPAGDRLQGEFIEPIRATLGDADLHLASMIMSMLIGISIMRNLLPLPPVTDADIDRSENMVASELQAILTLHPEGEENAAGTASRS